MALVGVAVKSLVDVLKAYRERGEKVSLKIDGRKITVANSRQSGTGRTPGLPRSL